MIKLESLQFLLLVIENHNRDILQPVIAPIINIVISLISDPWYRVISYSMKVLSAIIKVMRPIDINNNDNTNSNTNNNTSYQFYNFVEPMYNAIKARLLISDIDVEIKEGAIDAMSTIMFYFGDRLVDEQSGILSLFLQRLESEVTRMSALRALAVVASSPLCLDLTTIIPKATSLLSSFLRQQSRVLKQSTLQCIDALINATHLQSSLSLLQVKTILTDISTLISDTDLHLTQMSLKVCLCVISNVADAAPIVCEEILPKAMDLAYSSLLQGKALFSLIQLLQELILRNVSTVTFDDMLQALTQRVGTLELPRQTLSNLSRCIAGITMKVSAEVIEDTVHKFAMELHGDNDNKKHLSLLSIGELGRQTDLSGSPYLKDLILECFESNHMREETKTAAAFALGHLAVGSMSTYLPIILQAVESSKHQYLLLAALREVIIVHANTGKSFMQYVDSILPGLIAHSTAEEEGVRNMVAECLGALTAIHDSVMIPLIQQMASRTDNVYGRWTAATSIRYLFSRHTPSPLLCGPGAMEDILRVLLPDTDLEVRKSTLLLVNAAVHHHPEALASFIPTLILPQVIAALEVKLERVVDLGPFKHKVHEHRTSYEYVSTHV